MIVLTDEELAQLTGSSKPLLQRRELEYLKIPYRERRNGSPMVRRIDLESPELCPCAKSAAVPHPWLQGDSGKLGLEPQVQP